MVVVAVVVGVGGGGSGSSSSSSGGVGAPEQFHSCGLAPLPRPLHAQDGGGEREGDEGVSSGAPAMNGLLWASVCACVRVRVCVCECVCVECCGNMLLLWYCFV